MTFIKTHKILLGLLVAAVLLSLVPVAQAWLLIGDAWRGVPQGYLDEIIYYSHIKEVGTGNLFFGNPYLLEHRFDPPLVIFGSDVLAAIPLLLGLPLVPALMLNFMLWSAIFCGLYYRLFREFALSKWLSASVALFAYVQSYDQVFRASVRQEVFPFLILFYISLIRFLKRPEDRVSVIFLGLSAGITFYIYGFLWQTAVGTLGILALYALTTRQWRLLRGTLLASVLGGAVGAPPFFYTLWVTQQPYFWDSINRFGLVHTRLPMAEIIYSGAWVGVVLAMCAALYWFVPAMHKDRTSRTVLLFLGVTGVALWILQGSNFFTGQLLEIGEHIRRFIALWLPLATVLSVALAWRYRQYLSGVRRGLVVLAVVALAGANLYFGYRYVSPFIYVGAQRESWIEQQRYAAPLAWLQANEPDPVVVWGNPHRNAVAHVPVLTRHYVLYEEPTQYMLLSNDEIRERYLVSSYFDEVTPQTLKDSFVIYMGRANSYHLPKTIERGIKICRILHFYDGGKSCGVAPTPIELLGDTLFEDLAVKFTSDIRPHVKEYLKKYRVSYILKDVKLDRQYHPEELGAARVYNDGGFELWKLAL